jgi:hypothetical protein
MKTVEEVVEFFSQYSPQKEAHLQDKNRSSILIKLIGPSRTPR